MISLNSLFTGSAASAATMRRQSLSGRPALMPRTTTSTALGNSMPNFFRRLALQRFRYQARQAEKSNEETDSSQNQAAAGNQQDESQHHGGDRADDVIFLAVPGQAGLEDAHFQRDILPLGFARLDLLQALGDLPALGAGLRIAIDARERRRARQIPCAASRRAPSRSASGKTARRPRLPPQASTG